MEKSGNRGVVSAKRRGRLAINRDALFMRVVRVLLRERRREKVAQLLDTRRLLSANRDTLNETRILIVTY